MTHNGQNITDELLLSYLRNQVSEEQKTLVESWLNENKNNRSRLNEISTLWKHSAAWSDFEGIDISGDWKKVSEKMGLESRTIQMKPAGKNYLGSLLRIAAVAIVVISIGYMTWNLVANEGLPARQLVVLTGEEPATFNLPDGSTIHLNANSGLSYPKKFRRNNRKVELNGEAFFEIAPDTKRPFSVISGDAVIKVPGTSFNVCSDPSSDKVTVTVAEGKVLLFPIRQEKRAIQLTIGEQGIYEQDNLTKSDTPNSNAHSWRTGILQFDQATLPEVIVSLEKHYKTTIIVKESPANNPGLTSVFENQPLEEVLDELNLLLGLEYRQKNDTIFVQIE